MFFTHRAQDRFSGKFEVLKHPEGGGSPSQRDPKVVETVSAMLSDLERRGMDAVREYSQKLDHYSGDREISRDALASTGDRLPDVLREAIELGARRTRTFADASRGRLSDFECELEPGMVAG